MSAQKAYDKYLLIAGTLHEQLSVSWWLRSNV